MTPRRTFDIETRRAEFESTALPFLDGLYRTALRLTRSADDAGDLVQETCLRAYRTFENFTPGTNCRGWLLTILYSIFHNDYHRRRRQPTQVSIDELEGQYQRYLESADDAAGAAETHPVPGASGVRVDPEVAAALDRLPEEFRAAVLFVDVEGLSYDEAAAIMGCPVGTVRSRLFRGRRLLFAALQAYAATLGYGRGER
jgi:RNA polymerase sigma-70 factor (ECF subfamily)